MPLRVPRPTAQAAVPIPGSPVSMEADAWNATATTHVTVTSRLLMGRIATTVSAVGYGRTGSCRMSWDVGIAGKKGRRVSLGS